MGAAQLLSLRLRLRSSLRQRGKILLTAEQSAIIYRRMRRYSTREVAKKLGLHLATIQRYLAEGKIPAPPVQQVGAGKFRVWTDEDIEKVKEVLPKIANGRKTRYQKLREKQKGQTKKKKRTR